MIRPQQFVVRRDRNGNKIVTIYPAKWQGRKTRFKAFSIQTLGNLPECHKLELGYENESHINTHLWAKINDYLYKYGTEYQKSLFNLSDAKRRAGK